VQNLTGDEIRRFLDLGIKATVNSDDPAYFRGYINENLVALAERAAFSREELVQVTRNAFEISWADEQSKTGYLKRLDDYVAEL
jgi:adenosine deaminase